MDIGGRRGYNIPSFKVGVITAVIIHWTAGADGVNSLEADSYNYIIGRDGKVTEGDFPISAQIPPIKSGKYAAHTLNANSRRVGVSLDAMAGANESPFRTGSNPITEVQLDAMARLVADINKACKLKVLRTTNLTHAEVQRTLGIRQNNKWDITWLPGMTKPGDAIEVGDRLRKRISGYM